MIKLLYEKYQESFKIAEQQTIQALKRQNFKSAASQYTRLVELARPDADNFFFRHRDILSNSSILEGFKQEKKKKKKKKNKNTSKSLASTQEDLPFSPRSREALDADDGIESLEEVYNFSQLVEIFEVNHLQTLEEDLSRECYNLLGFSPKTNAQHSEEAS